MIVLETEQALWLVCATFYLIDLVRQPAGNRLLVERRAGAYRPIIPLYRFLIAGRALTFLNPLTPWRETFQTNWLSRDRGNPNAVERSTRRVRVFKDRLLGLRWSTSLAFGSMFFVAPVLTEKTGLGTALSIVLPCVFVSWLNMGACMFANRAMLGMTRLAIVGCLVEYAFCPGLLANGWRRLALSRLPLDVDVVAFCAATTNSSALRETCENLRAYTEDLVERGIVTRADLAAYPSCETLFHAR